LASVVSHDLQNPLTIAQGYLDQAQSTGEAEYFDHAADALGEIREISEGVVTMARIGQQVESPDPVDAETLVQSCWQELDAPEATLSVERVGEIAARRRHLRELFERLLENAVVHGPADVDVTVGETEAGFFVADDGPGVDSTRRESVVEAAYSTVQGRTGLDLAVARAAAEAHGWRLTIGESEAGGFRVDIVCDPPVPTR